NGSSNEL
ncbi:phage regulatory protein Rha, partial [Haemophilus influenzae]